MDDASVGCTVATVLQRRELTPKRKAAVEAARVTYTGWVGCYQEGRVSEAPMARERFFEAIFRLSQTEASYAYNLSKRELNCLGIEFEDFALEVALEIVEYEDSKMPPGSGVDVSRPDAALISYWFRAGIPPSANPKDDDYSRTRQRLDKLVRTRQVEREINSVKDPDLTADGAGDRADWFANLADGRPDGKPEEHARAEELAKHRIELILATNPAGAWPEILHGLGWRFTVQPFEPFVADVPATELFEDWLRSKLPCAVFLSERQHALLARLPILTQVDWLAVNREIAGYLEGIRQGSKGTKSFKIKYLRLMKKLHESQGQARALPAWFPEEGDDDG